MTTTLCMKNHLLLNRIKHCIQVCGIELGHKEGVTNLNRTIKCDQPHECYVCGQNFKDNKNLTVPKRIHTGVNHTHM